MLSTGHAVFTLLRFVIMKTPFTCHTHRTSVCVVGGGMAGLIAAVAAARRGANTVLIHDRPVLGGNASSEVRMWICGARGHHRKETGLLEEIQLANLARNPSGLYAIWDSVLFEYAKFTPRLTTLLNCSVNDATLQDGCLTAVKAWQLTTQQWHVVEADLFIDCSGDSILAPLAGAEVRYGRESREAFGESIAPRQADLKTMGNSLLLQLEETDSLQPFRPPRWAYYFDDQTHLPDRLGQGFGSNFWWLELGGIQHTIDDAEAIRDELVKTAWGVWDYMKNRAPQADKLRNWRVRWLGALPGKRENRRYVGDHILTQNDIASERAFEDIVAYGGWPMDDHHPAGLYYPGRATIFHPAPSPYGIPFRCLYSRNVPNLLCAGRNISTTHAALSSTRVMGTCALLGQAVGTAAALCVAEDCLPRAVTGARLRMLQAQLMDDDVWLPGQVRPADPLTLEADWSQSGGGPCAPLWSGLDREPEHETQHWEGQPGDALILRWNSPRYVECLRLVLDSDLAQHKRMPCSYPRTTVHGSDEKPDTTSPETALPASLVRTFRIEVQDHAGNWSSLHREEENIRRLVVCPVQREVRALRWTAERTWGAPDVRVYSLDATTKALPAGQAPPAGRSWQAVIADCAPEDLAPPDHGLEKPGKSVVGA